VAESIRNIVATGAKPIAIADCCNFGNPENPEVFWQFKRSIDGLSYMLNGLEIPCIGGNVSFYNEDERTGTAVKPTIVIVALGLIDDLDHITTLGLKESNQAIILIGKTYDEIGGSQFSIRFNGIGGKVPKARQDRERASINSVLSSIRKGYITASHDCSKGGLAIALAKMAMNGRFGAIIDLKKVPKKDLNPNELLFSESHGRFIVSSRIENVDKILKICKDNNASASLIGKTNDEGTIKFSIGKEIIANCEIKKMRKYWKDGIQKYIS
jgi:phosphoribosylformylglycinamidine synthase